ncbi:unnamed protein product [Cuscuta epithymum]|uniref:Uncharacterized protein n=1 Tax=Cuscuta epithymum TaxID=186058 RepID=A0AAV0D539_9ASTE|nr:unnamed protein product [Cuscuta epithymum]
MKSAVALKIKGTAVLLGMPVGPAVRIAAPAVEPHRPNLLLTAPAPIRRARHRRRRVFGAAGIRRSNILRPSGSDSEVGPKRRRRCDCLHGSGRRRVWVLFRGKKMLVALGAASSGGRRPEEAAPVLAKRGLRRRRKAVHAVPF